MATSTFTQHLSFAQNKETVHTLVGPNTTRNTTRESDSQLWHTPFQARLKRVEAVKQKRGEGTEMGKAGFPGVTEFILTYFRAKTWEY